MNEHARAAELLPWMVNGRIEVARGPLAQRSPRALRDLPQRAGAQRRIRDALTREPTVEFAPQASFNRLWKRIEAEAAGSDAVARWKSPTRQPSRSCDLYARRSACGPGCAPRWPHRRRRFWCFAACCGGDPTPTAYRTVTDAAPGPNADGPVIKAIFDDQVRLADVKEILADAGLVVASGPSEAGVYTLVPRDARSRGRCRAQQRDCAPIRVFDLPRSAHGRCAGHPSGCTAFASASPCSPACSQGAPAAPGPAAVRPMRRAPKLSAIPSNTSCSRLPTIRTRRPARPAAPAAATAATRTTSSVTAHGAR